MVADQDERLSLNVGCEFAFETTLLTTAVLQVAPSPQADMQLRSETWETNADHHGYLDDYGNRCERFTFVPGSRAWSTGPRSSASSRPT